MSPTMRCSYQPSRESIRCMSARCTKLSHWRGGTWVCAGNLSAALSVPRDSTAGFLQAPHVASRRTYHLGWSTDAGYDLGYHARRFALPAPAGCELLELTSRLHPICSTGTARSRNT